MMPPLSPIDRDALDTLLDAVGRDLEFLAELLDEFFNDTPVQFQTMERGLSAGDAETFRRAAHSMKSNSANFGAVALSGLFKELEEMGKNGQLEDASSLFDQAKAEYQRVETALKAVLKEL
jgi:HPt (histidine-containing phosphotransfer) domain-containing protein